MFFYLWWRFFLLIGIGFVKYLICFIICVVFIFLVLLCCVYVKWCFSCLKLKLDVKNVGKFFNIWNCKIVLSILLWIKFDIVFVLILFNIKICMCLIVLIFLLIELFWIEFLILCKNFGKYMSIEFIFFWVSLFVIVFNKYVFFILNLLYKYKFCVFLFGLYVFKNLFVVLIVLICVFKLEGFKFFIVVCKIFVGIYIFWISFLYFFFLLCVIFLM